MRTCNQTGNDAPRFPWSNSPEGRTARFLIQCIAYHLGYDDDRMGRLRQFPPSRTTFDLFNRTLPWFAAHYNGHVPPLPLSAATCVNPARSGARVPTRHQLMRTR
jgi:hypothetical protein